MIIEHLFCNCAIAIIAGMILTSERTGDNIPYTLIIIGSTWIPDISTIIASISLWARLPLSIQHLIPNPSCLHNLAGLLVYSFLVGLLLRPFGFRFRYAALCGALGYGSHLLADSLTHKYEYSMLWPISPQLTSIETFFPYYPDFFGIAETRVLLACLLILILAIGFRTIIQGTGWINGLFTKVHR